MKICYNNLFLIGLSLIGGYLSFNNDTIDNYNSTYEIIKNNLISIELKNEYEKLFFNVSLENSFICLFNADNKLIKTIKA